MNTLPNKCVISFLIWLSLTTEALCDITYIYNKEKEPTEIIELLKKQVKETESDIKGNTVIAIGHDGLTKAIQDKKHNVVAAFISRGDFESITEKYKRRDISVLYFDPKPSDMHKVATMIIRGSIGINHNIGVLSSWRSKHWFEHVNIFFVRVRKKNSPPNSVLQGDISKKLLIIPADNSLMEGLSLADLVSTLLEKRTALIGFSPYMKNSAANVYYAPNKYARELAVALKYTDSFKAYPSNPNFVINKRILNAIGIRYNGPLKGDIVVSEE